MSDKNTSFTGNVPEFYDQHLGPVFFEPYAADLATRVASVAPAGPVLEIACGTGILTKHLRAKLLSTAQLVSTDLQQAMIDKAFEKYGPIDVEWRQADACSLPFGDRTFSAVANQFGMMFVPDKLAALREAKRVLRDNGILAFNIWDSMDQNPYARMTHETVAKFFDTDPPSFYQIPFGFPDPEMWTQLLSQAGFGHVDVHHLTLEARSESALSFATGLVRGNPVAQAILDKGLPLDDVISAVKDGLVRLGGDHPFSHPMNAFVYTARANS